MVRTHTGAVVENIPLAVLLMTCGTAHRGNIQRHIAVRNPGSNAEPARFLPPRLLKRVAAAPRLLAVAKTVRHVVFAAQPPAAAARPARAAARREADKGGPGASLRAPDGGGRGGQLMVRLLLGRGGAGGGGAGPLLLPPAHEQREEDAEQQEEHEGDQHPRYDPNLGENRA